MFNLQSDIFHKTITECDIFKDIFLILSVRRSIWILNRSRTHINTVQSTASQSIEGGLNTNLVYGAYGAENGDAYSAGYGAAYLFIYFKCATMMYKHNPGCLLLLLWITFLYLLAPLLNPASISSHSLPYCNLS